MTEACTHAVEQIPFINFSPLSGDALVIISAESFCARRLIRGNASLNPHHCSEQMHWLRRVRTRLRKLTARISERAANWAFQLSAAREAPEHH